MRGRWYRVEGTMPNTLQLLCCFVRGFMLNSKHFIRLKVYQPLTQPFDESTHIGNLYS